MSAEPHLSRRSLRRSLAGLTLMLLAGSSWAQTTPPVKQRESDLKELRLRIDALKQDIERGEQEKNAAADAVRDADVAVDRLHQQVVELQTRRRQAEARLRATRSNLQHSEHHLRGLRDELAALLRYWHQHGDQDVAKLLFSGEDPNAINRELHLLGYITQEQTRLVQTLRQEMQALKHLNAQVSQEHQNLTQIEGEQRSRQAALEAEQNRRRNTLTQVRSAQKARQQEVERLQKNEQRLSHLITRLNQVIREQPKRPNPRPSARPTSTPESGPTREPVADATVDEGAGFAQLKGKLRWPTRGSAANRFGDARPEGGTSWKGVFIRGRTGQDVRAVASGRVVYADWLRGFGNLLIIDHGDTYLTLYGFNDSLLKPVGAQVHHGETVALVGSSGGQADSGVYFEIRHQGKPVDPSLWVR